MCLIIDVNIAHRVFLNNADAEFWCVRNALFSGNPPIAKIVYGGKLAEELSRNKAIRKVLVALDRAGRAILIDSKRITTELAWVLASRLCISDDQHIIALARASGVRLLCSHDNALQTDFKNGSLINNPRGKIYKNANHRGLILRFCRRA